MKTLQFWWISLANILIIPWNILTFSLLFSNQYLEISKETQVIPQFGEERQNRNVQFQLAVASGRPGLALCLQAQES